MKIIDLDNNILTDQLCDWDLVEDVFKGAEKSLRWNSRNSLSHLLDDIPVFLLNDEDMHLSNNAEPSLKSKSIRGNYEESENNDLEAWYYLNKLKKISNPESKAVLSVEDDLLSSKKSPYNSFSQPGMEYFGFYSRNDSRYTERYQAVYLCPERIFSETGNRFLNNILLAAITIHTFAHARMEADLSETFTSKELGFFRFIEEPLSNWFVMKYFYSSNALLSDIAVAERFISAQPEEYRYGLNLFSGKTDDSLWQKWTSSKIEINNRRTKSVWPKNKSIGQISKIYSELLKTGKK